MKKLKNISCQLTSLKIDLKMKLSIYLFLISLFQIQASTYSQNTKVSLDVNEVPIAKVFELIESKTEFKFLVATYEVDVSRKVSIQKENASVTSILEDIFSGFSVTIEIVDKQILIKKETQVVVPKVNIQTAQERTITGLVTDNEGMPLPGASILVKGTKKGTNTDFDGKFTLDIKKEVTLLVSFLGYIKKEVVIATNKDTIIISLTPQDSTLDEVIVVGYGTQKRASVTGAVSQVGGAEILKTKAANIEASLVGRVPGLTMNIRSGQPGEDAATILIRGKGTLGDASPLIVIDGVANRGGFSRLNSYDIETFSILKDASAAIYGAQSANGVIVITTKRGKLNTFKKPTLSFSTEYTLTQPVKEPRLMDALQMLTWEDEERDRLGIALENQDIIKGYKEGTLDPNEWGNTDWWNQVTDTWSPQQRHSLSLEGANENIAYYTSIAFLDQQSIFKNSVYGYKQYNATANIDFSVTDNLQVGVTLSSRQENRLNPNGDIGGVMGAIYTQRPYDIPYYSNGLLADTEVGNPIPIINGTSGDSESVTRKSLNKVSFKLDLPNVTQGLFLSGFAAYDLFDQESQDLRLPYDVYSYSSSTGEYTNLKELQGGGIYLSQESDNTKHSTLHFRVGYKRGFKNHNFNFFAAYEQSINEGNRFWASRNSLISPDLLNLDLGADISKDNGGARYKTARQNYFGRFNYAYDQRYLFELTMRYDGSPNFAPDNRFGFFPGASFGWNVSKESFFNVDVINNLKLRGSVGKLGNDKIAPFQYDTNYNASISAELQRGTNNYVEWYNRNVIGENKEVTQGFYPSVRELNSNFRCKNKHFWNLFHLTLYARV